MNILLFGVTRDIIGQSKLQVPEQANIGTVGALKCWLVQQYPAMAGLSSLAVAVDSEYADDDDILSTGQEIALIPPVSGG